MLNKNEQYGEVIGLPGAKYEQIQDGKTKLFNSLGLECETVEDGLSCRAIEEMPEGMVAEGVDPEPESKPLTFDDTKDSALTVHERIRITDEKDSNYMTEDNIKSELTNRNVSFDKRMGRKKLVAILQHELGG